LVSFNASIIKSLLASVRMVSLLTFIYILATYPFASLDTADSLTMSSCWSAKVRWMVSNVDVRESFLIFCFTTICLQSF
jgi:hypothetical protein